MTQVDKQSKRNQNSVHNSDTIKHKREPVLKTRVKVGKLHIGDR